MQRCDWATSDKLYCDYHDREWGVPLHDDRLLFELLILEGAQAGLSWLTILRRRESYRTAYEGFDPEVMARWSDEHLAELVNNPAIIRNRLKIEAARSNARAFLEVVAEHGSLDRYLWSLVGGRPICRRYRLAKEVPTTTAESDWLSRDLKRRGFKFVGSTICYAFMQAAGLVNDHLESCFRFDEINRLSGRIP